MSDFSSLRIGLSALNAQRRAIEITGHNISNANTEGYSRQRVDLESVAPPSSYSLWGKTMGAGQGVRIRDITRFRDQFLELRAGQERSTERFLSTQQTSLARMEDYFAEPSDVGIGHRLSEFWAGWDDLANHPSDVASRSQLLERTGTLVSTIRDASIYLRDLRSDTISELQSVVSHVNSVAREVAALNEQIKTVINAGLNANDLKDQRDLKVQELAEQVGATARYGDVGQVDVFVGGSALVLENRSFALGVATTGPTVAVTWAADGSTAVVSGGEAGGALHLINSTIPDRRSQLDDVAAELIGDVNGLHARVAGTLAAGSQDLTAAGTLSFDVALDGGGYTTVSIAGADWSGPGGAAALQTALQSALDAAVGAGNGTVQVTGGTGNPMSISITPASGHVLTYQAASGNTGFTTLLGDTAVGRDGVGGRPFFDGTDATSIAVGAQITGRDALAAGRAGGGALDNSVALDLAELADATDGADAAYRTFITSLGVESQNVTRRLEVQGNVVSQMDGARSARSGVDIDEEMVNLVQYQHAYQAAARFVTAVDQMLDTLINSVGLIGR